MRIRIDYTVYKKCLVFHIKYVFLFGLLLGDTFKVPKCASIRGARAFQKRLHESFAFDLNKYI